MQKREPIKLNMDIVELIVTMSEGNPGAATVLTQLAKTNDGIALILHLDDMNIRGWQIWIGYKDHCKMDIEKFAECIKNRDKDMIATINKEAEMYKEAGMEDQYFVAVEHGASFR